MAVDPLPVRRAAELAEHSSGQTRWLVRDLWSTQGVGFLAGSPKAMKTWMGLDLAISVASGTACLGRFAVEERGPVLAFLAEDRHREIRQRVAAICRHRNLALDSLDLHFIAVPLLQLHQGEDSARLKATVESLHPKLLLLDPLVRIWGADENSAQEISALLSFLRTLQRRYRLAILIVHHFTKRSHSRLGQALRGSGDLWAWSDDNAYLVRNGDHLVLHLEHRSAPSAAPITLRLIDSDGDGGALHLEIVEQANPADTSAGTTAPPLEEQILEALRAAAPKPRTRDALRKTLRVNNDRLGQTLRALEEKARIRRAASGWTVAP
jgi:hypothetical protein